MNTEYSSGSEVDAQKMSSLQRQKIRFPIFWNGYTARSIANNISIYLWWHRFSGPRTVAVDQRKEKGYNLLFKCKTLRTVHIELFTSLDKSSVINAFRRFICRSGPTKKIRTDNGTDFFDAERELRDCYSHINHNLISEELSWNVIVSKFFSPGVSHMGALKSVNTKELTDWLKLNIS